MGKAKNRLLHCLQKICFKQVIRSVEDPNEAAMSIGMQRWRRRIENICKTAICSLPGEMPGYGGTLFNLFQTIMVKNKPLFCDILYSLSLRTNIG